ncbi:MAG: decaprenyl-phosphate phosphoribosyltransferase [Planctomycetia bacterium]|nr:decaprenyl-phosphate phosphoribosyltransferase [Planctomycetia bacterium]
MNLLRLLRPHQWVKNAFVLLPVLFSGVLEARGILNVSEVILPVFVAFCAWSSAVYVLNDIVDRKADATHPRKKNRPIASGKVSVSLASVVGFLLVIVPIVWFTVQSVSGNEGENVSQHALLVLVTGCAYLVNSLLYCFWVKKQAILDVFSIAFGFVIRILAGCGALGVMPSSWILVCTFSVALFLGFGKRRAEIAILTPENEFRSVLRNYSSEFLNILLAISGSLSLMTYLLYTLDPHTAELHHTQSLIFSVPFVFFGIFRYAQNVLSGKFDGPDEVLLRDPIFLINSILWCICIQIIFMFR